MESVRKFEFVNDGSFYVIERPIWTLPNDIPQGQTGKFCRTWIGETEAYRVVRLQETQSKYLRTLMTKNGYKKIKNGEYV